MEMRGTVLNLSLSQPERRNVLGSALLVELVTRLGEVATAPTVRAVVLSGDGTVFSAGHDLRELESCSPEEAGALFKCCAELMLTIRDLPVPVIASVRGLATAAGCQLVAACDLAVAGERARFQTPGGLIGLFCSSPAVPLVRAIGRKRAMEMLLLAEPIDANTAAAWGLVNHVVPEAELDLETDRLVAAILRSSPDAIARGKAAFYRQADLDERAAYDVATQAMVRDACSADATEGMRAFLEKRPAVWGPRGAKRR